MTIDQQKKLLASAVNTWGPEAQMNQAIEEAAELICALRHHLRGRVSNLVEEIADVEIMLAQLRLMIGDGPNDQAKEQKLNRLADRLAEIGEGGL